MKTKIILASALLIVAGVINGCKKSSTPASPGTNEVFIQNTAFTPASITVPVNTIVKWTNKDAVTHTVTSNATLFDSGNLSSGAAFSYQFLTGGTVHYHCNIHPGMTGTIIVQ